MTKAAAVRSILRRRALTKAADDYSDMMNGYANANRGIVRAGTRIAVNDNLRKSGYPPAATRPAPAATARPAPAAQPRPAPATRPAPGGALARIRSKLGR